eukprot:8086125-Karenia_brevis.AAC.1
MARLWHPLTCKAVLSLRSPLQWKGGQIFDLYKGKGDEHDCGSYRDVTCCDAAARMLARPLRQSIMPVLSNFAPMGQFGGGLNGGGTDFAHMLLKGAQQYAASKRMSFGILFVDLQT